MIHVLLPAAAWWLALTVVGWAAVPLVTWLLRPLPDRGLALARPVGLVLVGYGYWLAVTAGLLPNTRLGAALALAALLGVGGWLAARNAEELLAFLRARRRYVLGTEALFAVVLLAWAVYRAYVPTIEPAGGEKFMEMAFINATLQSATFPPHDPWLSGFAISYYYFGYLQAALLILLTGVTPAVAFNLVIPGTLAMTCVGAFGLGWGLVALHPGSSRAARVVGGAFSAGSLALLGSLAGALELAYMQGWGPLRLYEWLAVKDLTPGGVCGTSGSGFGAGGLVPPRFIWWWRGSRVLHDNCGEVIHEFPFFSFMLGDVHPHVMALPFVVAVLGLALAVLLGAMDREGGGRPGPRLAVAALVVGALGFLNTWDLPTFGAAVVLAYALRAAALPAPAVRPARSDLAAAGIGLVGTAALAWRLVPAALETVRGLPADAQPMLARVALTLAVTLVAGAVGYGTWARAVDGREGARRAVATARFALWLVGLAVVLYLPFYVGFRSQASGMGFSAAHSRLGQWLVHFGMLAFLGLSTTIAWLPAVRRLRPCGASLLVLAALLPVAVWSALRQAWTPALVALLAAAAAVVALQLWTLALASARDGADQADPAPVRWAAPAFALGCVAAGMALALVPEFVFVRDLFNSRMNTVFKLFFQAWVFLAFGGVYAVHSVVANWPRRLAAAWAVPALVLVCASALYPLQALYTRTDGFALRPISLDGLGAWSTHYPHDLAAVHWLRQNAPAGSVIVEAYGGAYEHKGRISMATGLPAVLGWEGHEHQWRGTRENIDPRKADIALVYTTQDEAERDRLLERYGVRYVVLSDEERSKFDLAPAHEERLRRHLSTVFEAPGGRLEILERR